MSDALAVLLRVKNIKEEQALRDANAKRDAAAQAAEETESARAMARDSAATLEARQDAIYDDILGKVINLDDIEETKGRVVRLEKEHGRLVDAEERAIHIQADAEREREAAVALHRKSLRDVDKYVLLLERLRAEDEAASQLREEIEIEDLFSTNRRSRL